VGVRRRQTQQASLYSIVVLAGKSDNCSVLLNFTQNSDTRSSPFNARRSGQSDNCSSLGRFFSPSWTIGQLFLTYPIFLSFLDNRTTVPICVPILDNQTTVPHFATNSAPPSWIFRRSFQPNIFADDGSGGAGVSGRRSSITYSPCYR